MAMMRSSHANPQEVWVSLSEGGVVKIATLECGEEQDVILPLRIDHWRFIEQKEEEDAW